MDARNKLAGYVAEGLDLDINSTYQIWSTTLKSALQSYFENQSISIMSYPDAVTSDEYEEFRSTPMWRLVGESFLNAISNTEMNKESFDKAFKLI